MEGGGREHDAWEPLWSARSSLASSSSGSLQDIGGELDDEQILHAEDKVFVAVAEEVSDGESALLWAMHNLVKDGTKVVIAHVHSPAQHEAKMRDHTSMKPEEVKEYTKLKREKAEKNIDAYAALITKCTGKNLEVGYEKVIIEMDDVAEGLDKLIALQNITILVMGAAADNHYSKEMNTPKSKTALKLMDTAPPSCKIWFTCKGHLICTREASEILPAIPSSPGQSNAPLLAAHSISKQMRSRAPAQLEYEISSSKECTSSSLIATDVTDRGMTVYGSSGTNDAINISRAKTLPVIIGDTNELTPVVHSPTTESDNVYLLPASVCYREDEPSVDELYYKLQDSCTETELLKNEADEKSNKIHKAKMDLLSALQRIQELEDSHHHEVIQRKEMEKIISMQRLEIDKMKTRCHTLSDELQDSTNHRVMLEHCLTQIRSAEEVHKEKITGHYMKQLSEESKKSQKLEMDMLSMLQRVKEVECLYQNEKAQREDMEKKVEIQRVVIEETKRWRDELFHELQDVQEQKLKLERVDVPKEANRRKKAERDLVSVLRRIKDLEHRHIHEMEKQEAMEKTMATQKEEIQEKKIQLHEIHDKHMKETKYAVKVHEEKLAHCKQLLQELLVKNDKLRASVIIEFSFVELQQATKGFDAESKIGEDKLARAYKGSIRKTNVAIKLLHPQSVQGEAEFHQQVAVLARVRHPNILTLVGACRDPFALVYEFLPNGSLEDWLSCKKNMPPLEWKVRTRIIGEICSALAFIHSQRPDPIVHGDLNLGNILLDANFVSKLGNLGMCQLLKQSNLATTNLNRHHTKNHIGTPRCMDRGEFLSKRELALWPDVHSFGIIILRLLTGRLPERIAEIVQEEMKKGQLHSIMDTSAGEWPLVQATKLASLGLRCVNLSKGRLPDLAGDVWEVINPLIKATTPNSGPSRFSSSSDDAYTPPSFICPIFQEVMTDPHMAADGYSYEAEAIRKWLDTGANTSPMTNLRLAHRVLTPNITLRSAILEWQQQQQHVQK